jgi:predicted nucleotidyltransferase
MRFAPLPRARLELFGSATGDSFDPQRSDVDFLVSSNHLPTASTPTPD